MMRKALSVSITLGIVSTKQEIMQNHRMPFNLGIEINKLVKHGQITERDLTPIVHG
jgi:hypothetical protein